MSKESDFHGEARFEEGTDHKGTNAKNIGRLDAEDVNSSAVGRIINEFDLAKEPGHIEIPTGQHRVIIEIDYLRATSSDVSVHETYMDVYADGGWFNGNYEYRLREFDTSGGDNDEFTHTGDEFLLLTEGEWRANRGTALRIEIPEPSGSEYNQIEWSGSVNRGTGVTEFEGVGRPDNDNAIEKVRIWHEDQDGTPDWVNEMRGRVIIRPGDAY